MANFIDKHAARQQIIEQRADDLWQEARAALQDCCNSFRKYYGNQVQDTLENGLRIRITRLFRLTDRPSAPQDVKRRIVVSYNKNELSIEVTVDDSPTKRFSIDADDKHAFIADDTRELSLDEFAKLALEKPLFAEPVPGQPIEFW